jgi:hypothetical protein
MSPVSEIVGVNKPNESITLAQNLFDISDDHIDRSLNINNLNDRNQNVSAPALLD